MAKIEGEILIGRPVEEVFDFVADSRNEPQYNPRWPRRELLTPTARRAGGHGSVRPWARAGTPRCWSS